MKHIVLILILLLNIAKAHSQSLGIYSLPPFERAACVIKHFESIHTAKDYPYIGYGHRIQKGEHFYLPLTKQQADSLLRDDLSKLCRMFRKHTETDALLLATLAYNVGYGRVIRSQLFKKITSGDRDVKADYISFCRYQGKPIPSIRMRRRIEWKVIMNRKSL